VTAPLPAGLAANPRLSRWLRLAADGAVTVRVGKVELGQGILTALAQIAADELDVDIDDVRMVAADTTGPDEGITAGSMSVAHSGAALRQVCAEARALFVAEAARRLGGTPERITVRDGVLSDEAGKTTTYGELAHLVDLDRAATGAASPKTSADLRVVGTSVPRLDLPDKIAGRPRFIQDLELPGQAYGRVVRPPSPAATLEALDTATVESLPGVVAVVRDGSFLGVVADDADRAERAATALRAAARWAERDTLPDEDAIAGFLRAGPHDTVLVEQTGTPGPAVRRIRASYSRPYLAHASIAPSCAAAQWHPAGVRVWTHSQGIYRLRDAIAQALGIDAGAVDVQHVESAGCYGHNGADDVAFDAVLLARSARGRPVHVLWSRADELIWAPFGSAMVADVEAAVDAAGDVASWSYDVFSQGHTARPGYAGAPGLLAAAHLAEPHPLPPAADPPAASGAGSARNAVPSYAFPHRAVRGHRALRAPLRTSALRALGAFLNVFAIESFMDELALAAGRDPLEYRLAQLTDPRARAVLAAAADLGGWARRGGADGVGRGIGFARYKGNGAFCAVVAEVEAVATVRVRRLAAAVDVGRVVSPDGVRNQIEGGAIQAMSWTLKERVRFDRRRVTSGDWETYPILRFAETPRVDVAVISRPDEPSVGAGEAAQGPTAAAIGNALADAIGVRVRDLPLTPERVIAAMDSPT
jgi:CO/xanthine dehydrogenase Mo-binding subunit